MQAEVAAALVPLGYAPEDRAFKAHLTLARSRDPRGDEGLAGASEALRDIDLGEAAIDALVLFRSDLSAAGPRYTALGRYSLGR
jgi:2'-5' RNA ligase